MIKQYQNTINSICDRFNNQITGIDIIAWLENFDKRDWSKALIVLNAFEFYNTKDIVNEFNYELRKILEKLGQNEKLYVTPVGKIGKSGAAMVYYLKKAPSFKSKKVRLVENHDFLELEDNSKVLVVDDFSGTGGSIIDYYSAIKSNLPENHEIIALTVAYMEKAEIALKKASIEIFGNKRTSAFTRRGSVFGYFPKMISIRKFCFKYGDLLYPREEYKNKKTKQHPFGFKNSQTLLGFAHSIPNNCIPIIWADRKRKDTNEKWIPLFPRRGNLIIKEAREFKRNQKYWTSIAFKLGIAQTHFSEDEKYDKTTMQLISLIYLKRKQKNEINICQLFGINLKEYEDLLQIAINKNLFDEEEELTKHGITIYENIKKRVRSSKKEYLKPELLIEEDVLYIPKIFRGSS